MFVPLCVRNICPSPVGEKCLPPPLVFEKCLFPGGQTKQDISPHLTFLTPPEALCEYKMYCAPGYWPTVPPPIFSIFLSTDRKERCKPLSFSHDRCSKNCVGQYEEKIIFEDFLSLVILLCNRIISSGKIMFSSSFDHFYILPSSVELKLQLG